MWSRARWRARYAAISRRVSSSRSLQNEPHICLSLKEGQEPAQEQEAPGHGSSSTSRPEDGPLQLDQVTLEGAAPVQVLRAENSSSATNVDAPLIETPATVNVLTKDFLNTIAPRALEDAIQYVPGASVENAGDPFSPKFNLRGFTVDSLQSGGIYVDGYQGVRRGYHFDRSLYEQIDILKGTSSVLYGLANPGGVVNYTSKRPQFEAAHRVEATLGSFDTTRGTIDLTGPLSNSGKNLAYRLITTAQESNQTVNGQNNDISFDDQVIVKPSLTWRTPTKGALNISYEYSHIESVFDPGIKRLDDGQFLFDTEPYVGPESGFDRKFHVGTFEFIQPVSDRWNVLIGGALARSDNVSEIDSSFFGPLDGTNMPRWTARSLEDYEQEEVRAELQGQFDTGSSMRHDLTLGVSYLRTEVSVDRGNVTTNDAIDPFNPRFGPAPDVPTPVRWFKNGTDPEKSVYLQDRVSIRDHFKVFGGLRYTDFEVFREHISASDFRRSDQAVDWNAGVIYNHNPWFNPFASVSTSTQPQQEVNAPREGEQIEVGLKSEWFDGRLATTASIFQVEQTDIAEADPANPGVFTLAGDQRTRGLELQATGEITRQLSLLAGYSYLDAEFSESTTGNKGNRPHSVPEHKVSLFGQYAFTGDFNGWRAGLGFIHVGDRSGNNANTFDLPSYERVDAFVGFAHDGFDFRVSVENVLDEEYIAGSAGNGHRLAQGAPRFFTVGAGYEF